MCTKAMCAGTSTYVAHHNVFAIKKRSILAGHNEELASVCVWPCKVLVAVTKANSCTDKTNKCRRGCLQGVTGVGHHH